jgi:tRNA acetyltransferase TAN1
LELIVTCARHFEEEASREIGTILEEIGDDSPEITVTKFSGILTVKTAISHIEAIKHIQKKLEDEPWTIRYIMRIIPMFEIVECTIKSIAESAVSQARKIKDSETYRITIEKRDSDIKSADIIASIAERLPNKVSLEKYDWIILIQTIGDICGVSIVKDNEILSVERLKRASFE